MAIAFDSANQGTIVNNASSLNFNQTLGGSATICYVQVMTWVASSVTITAMTVGGQTYNNYITQTSANGSWQVYLFWFFSPPTGTQNIAVTLSGSSTNLVMRSASYTGTTTTIAPDTLLDTSGGAVTTYNTANITPSFANSWVIAVIENSAIGSSAGTATTFRSGSPNGDGIFDTNAAVSSPTSLQVTVATAKPMTGTITAIAPAGSVAFVPLKSIFVRQAVNRASTY